MTLHLRLIALLCCALVVSNSASAQSISATLTAPTGTYDGGGGTVRLTATLTYTGLTPSALGWEMTMPVGWRFVGVAGANVPQVSPTAGDTATIGFAYTSFPTNTATFTVDLAYDATLSGDQTLAAKAYYRSPLQEVVAPNITLTRAGAPVISTQPVNQAVAAGSGARLTAAISSAAGSTVQWMANGTAVAGGTSLTLDLPSVQPAATGIYTLVARSGDNTSTSTAAIVGVTTTDKVIGAGEVVGSNITHPNGNVFDQVLVTGAAEAITADWNLNQITRTSFIDVDGDIVQVEFSGPGTLSLVLDGATAPALAEKYNQPGVLYVTGHAGIVIAGANENTHVSVFTVGTATAVNQALFKTGVSYDGLADIAFIAISSTNGKFGGLRAANTTFFAQRGYTGIYAPGVEFTGPVFVGDISAFDEAQPVLVLGSASDVRVTGGDMLQDNGRAVQVSGITQLRFTDGSDSHGNTVPAQTNRATYQRDGADITAQIVTGP